MEEYFNGLLKEVDQRMWTTAPGMVGKEVIGVCREMVSYLKGKNRELKEYGDFVFGMPEVVMLDLPQISEDQPAHRPLIAAHASPWPGGIAVFRSASTDGCSSAISWASGLSVGTASRAAFTLAHWASVDATRAGPPTTKSRYSLNPLPSAPVAGRP